MTLDYKQFEQRKQDHIDLALQKTNQAQEHNALDSVKLIHQALPDLDFDKISIKATRFGKQVAAPFIISSMTAGHKNAVDINLHLIKACSDSGWAMGVGSQRRELTDKKAFLEWTHIRRDYSQVSLFSNLGIAQVINASIGQLQDLTGSLSAEALIIHCNPLQEAIQPEGTTQFKGCWEAIARTVEGISIPVIIKETGCGFSKETLSKLNEIGVAAVDVSGLGGTHWGRIEGDRASQNFIRKRCSETFKDWGIDTVTSVRNAVSIKPNFEIWGSGGVRHGLDAAKLIALGATTVGLAKPLLQAALVSAEEVKELMACIEYELKTALFCTGSQTLNDLKEMACL